MVPWKNTTLCRKDALELVDLAINTGHLGRHKRNAKKLAERLGRKQFYRNHFKASKIDALSVLNFAAKHGHVLLASLLMAELDVNPNITEYDEYGRITLHYAAMGGHLEIVTELMITYRSDANAPDKCGSTPLHLAIFFDHPDTACVMIRLAANLDVTRQNHFGMAMHSAAFNGSISVVKSIHEKYPTQVNALISGFLTPFTCAIYGAEPECEDFLKKVTSLNGKAFLYKVVAFKTEESDAAELVNSLIQLGADVNLCEEVLFEDPAIICAAKKGWRNVVSLLLEKTNRISGINWTTDGVVEYVNTDTFKQMDTVRVNNRVNHLKVKILEELNAKNCLTASIICLALKLDMNPVEWDHWKNLCQFLTCMLFQASPVKCDAADIYSHLKTFSKAGNDPTNLAWAVMGAKACLALRPDDPRFVELYNALAERAAGN